MQRKKYIEELLENIQVLKHKLFSGAVCYLGEGSITASQWLVLRQIQQHEGTTLKEIAQSLAMTSSAVTQLVEVLVGKEYVIKKTNADDRRELKLMLSEKSRKHIASLREKRIGDMENIFNTLNDKEFEEYCRLHAKIAQHMASK